MIVEGLSIWVWGRLQAKPLHTSSRSVLCQHGMAFCICWQRAPLVELSRKQVVFRCDMSVQWDRSLPNGLLHEGRQWMVPWVGAWPGKDAGRYSRFKTHSDCARRWEASRQSSTPVAGVAGRSNCNTIVEEAFHSYGSMKSSWLLYVIARDRYKDKSLRDQLRIEKQGLFHRMINRHLYTKVSSHLMFFVYSVN